MKQSLSSPSPHNHEIETVLTLAVARASISIKPYVLASKSNFLLLLQDHAPFASATLNGGCLTIVITQTPSETTFAPPVILA